MSLKQKILFLLSVMFLPLFGQDIPDPMDNPKRLVNDFAQIFDTAQRNDLEATLKAYNDSTSTQIYVVTVADLQGYAASDFASSLGQKWGVGQKGKDNGLVILIKPRVGNSRGDVYIATGYGVEHVLNDARVGRIIDEYMIPYFAQGDYYSGTRNAVHVIIKYLSGEFQPEKSESDIPMGVIVSLLVIVVLFIIAYTKNNNNPGGGNSSRGGGMFSPPLGGGRSSRGWGGGFGGGSFGGGGGGSFGGGGAGRGF